MRIRGAKTEMEELGLDTENMVESTSKLRGEIMALSGVDIMEADGKTFKSTYSILDELSQKWEDLSDIQQATVTELIAGKRQGNIVSSLMTNFDTARDALETSLNSAGSAMAEHEKWQQSLEARINSLKASWQSLSQTFLSSDFLKVVLDTVIKLVDALDWLVDKIGVLPTFATAFSIFQSFKGNGIFKPVIDEATGAAKGITSIFSKAANSVEKSLGSININNGFSASLNKDDVQSLINYQGQLQAGVDKTRAWNDCMERASAVAQDVARSNEFLSQGLNGYIKSQQAATVSTIAQNKSLGSAKTLLNEYYSGCKTTGMGQEAFKAAVQETNPQLAAQMTATGGATKGLFAYAASTAVAKAGAFALKVGVMALNATLTMGIGLIVGELISGIVSWINKEEELAEEVEEVTTKFNEQHKSLQKMKGDFDTDNESSMISRYEKLSKGVDHLGNNVSLASDEYSEYLSITNKIADTFPELIQGYDSQGNALLKCRDNVNALTTAYDNLIAANADSVLEENLNKIAENFRNQIDTCNSQEFWHYIPGIDILTSQFNEWNWEKDPMSDRALTFLEELLQAKKDGDTDKINSIIDNINSESSEFGLDYRVQIKQALQDKNVDIGNFNFEDKLREVLNTNPAKIQSIIDDYKVNMDKFASSMRTITTAALTKALDISSSEYYDMNDTLKNVAHNLVNSLDADFYEDFVDNPEGIVNYVHDVLDELNSISAENVGKIEAAFDFKTKFNGGDISYGQYIDQMKKINDTIDTLNVSDEIKTQLKLTLNSDEVIAEYNVLVNRLKNIGIDENIAKNFINGLSSSELAALDKLKLKAGATIDEIQSMIDEALAEEFTFDIKVQTEGIEALNKALTESRSVAGLTAESIEALTARYKDLEGFNAASLFEKTATGIRLNTEELNRLEEQYVSTNKLEIDKNLSILIEKYQDLDKKIKGCRGEQIREKEGLEASKKAIADKIEELSTLASQYDGLTSAFTKWQNALNGAEEGDNYDSVFENLEGMKELDDKKLFGTDKYKTFAQLMSYEDLSSASIDEIGDAFDRGYKKAERYFTEGKKGSTNFLNDLHAINSEWAHINKNGDWEVDINAEEAAKKLGISVEAVLLILDKLKDYGIKVEVEDSSVNNLQTKIQKTEAKLKELGQSPVDINVDIDASSANLEKIESEIEKAKNKIKEINSSSVDPNVKTAQLEDARAKLEALIQKKQEASQPAFMSLNTSQVNASLVDALEKIQSYQTALNKINELKELKSAGIAIDDSEISAAEEKLDGFAKAIQGLDGDVKVAIGLEEDGSIDSIHKAFEEGKVKIDANTDPALNKIEQLAENVERIEDKDVTINVTVNGLDQVKELNKQIDLATDIKGDIDKLSEYVENAKALKDLGENITSYVTAEVKGNVINTFEYKLNNLKVFSDSAKDIEEIGYVQSEISANIKGNVIDEFEYKIDNLKVYSDSAKNVSDIGNVESTVKANIEGNVTDEFEYKINNLKVFSDSAKDIYKIGNVESNVKATINSGEDGDVIDEFEYKLDNLKKFAEYAKELQNISDVDISVKATVNTGDSDDVVEEFEYKLDNLSEFANHVKELQGLKSVDISVNAVVNTGSDGDVVDEFEYKLNNLAKFADYVKELQGLESVNVSVNATVNTGDGSAVDEFEYKLNNLETFAEGAKALQGIGNVSSEITAKVNTGESGDAVDTFEYKLDNLKTFAEGAKALQGVGNVSSTVTAEINSGSDGDVIDEFEYKLNNLEKFAQYAKDLQGVGSVDISVSAKVNTGKDGDVTDTFEYKLNNLDEFASYAKELQGLEDVNITIKANVKTGEDSATNEWEYRLNNLNDFATYAKDLQGLESVDITITANTKGNVVGEKTESKINNLEVFAKGAKGLQELDNVDLTVKATVSGDVTETAEYKLDNLGVFKKHAKELQGIKDVDISVNAEISGNVPEKTEGYLDDLQVFAKGAKALQGLNDVDLSVNADIGGNVPDKTEGYLDDLQVFAKGAKALQGLSNVDISVNADVSGNAVTGDGVTGRLDRLTEFKSLVSGMSDKTVTVKVTANVDSEKVNDAITLLQGVADSGVFKNYTSTVQVGAKVSSIDDTVVKNYIATEKTAKGKVVWSNNDTAVNEFKNKIHEATGKVNWGNNTENVKTSFNATGKISWSSAGLPDLNGDGDSGWVNGTAHANGTAFKQGDWGIKGSGKALVGELGAETLVRDGKYYLIGQHGAEFIQYRPNDIIFNHLQTQELFSKGKVFSNGGRGKVFANGTANANGTAFASGTDDFKESFDWIEVVVSRLERAINNLEQTIDSSYKSWKSRESALGEKIGKLGEEIIKQQEAKDYYSGKASSAYTDLFKYVDNLSYPNDYLTKITTGIISIQDITDEKLAEKVKTYREWYEKSLAAEDAIIELTAEKMDSFAQYFESTVSKYEGILEGFNHTESMIDEYISQAEAKGHLVSSDYYQALIKNNEDKIIPTLIEQRDEMIAERNRLVTKGMSIDSEKYREMSNDIDGVTQEIEAAKTQTLEWQNEIRQLNWDNLDLAREKISNLNDEADFFVDLMSNKNLFNDDGGMTNEGLATMGVHAQKHNTYMYLADDYAVEIDEIDEQIEALDKLGDYDQNLIDRRQELVEAQQENILAAQDELQSIKDLISEGYDKELDALQEKIDKTNEAIDSQKDLLDHQRDVEKQTKNIASLEKRLKAYEGFEDEETRATVQQLKVELSEAKSDLESTLYDRYISDQSALLDELYNEYSETLNSRLDDLDGLIEGCFATVNEKADTINNTINGVAGEVGIEMSEELGNIWSGDNGIEGVVTKYYDGFNTSLGSVATTCREIKGYVATLAGKSDEEAKENIKKPTTTTSATSNHSSGSSGSSKPSSSTGNKSTGGDGKVKIGDRVKFLSGKYYYDSQGVNPAGSKNHGKYVYITNVNNKKWATHPIHISTGKKLGSGDLGWLKKNQISGYATGKKNFLNNEIAWTQEGRKQEFIVRPSDGAILTPIAKGDSVLNAQASGNIWDMANSPAEFIKDNLNLGTANVPNNSNVNNNYSQHIDNVVFRMDNVKNYEELLYALRDDRRFEKLVTAMTIDRIAGGSSLAKGKSIR